MKRLFSILVLSLMIQIMASSCVKERFYSGAVTLDGTTVRYLASEEDCTLKITAEGSRLTSIIYVKYWKMNQATMVEETIVDSIKTIPNDGYEKDVTLSRGYGYNLWIERNGETLGLGQFNL